MLSILIDGYKRIILEIIEDQHIRQRQRTTTRCMDQDPRMSSFLTSRLRLVNAYILITSIVPPSCRITSCKFITVVNLPCSRYSCFHITRQRFRFYAGRTQIGLSLAIRISKTISHILGTRRTRRCQNLFTDILCQCTATVCMNHCIDELTPILILIEVVCRSQTYMVPNVVLRRSNGTSKATHFDLRELEFQLKICRSDIFRSREFGHRNIGSTMSVFVETENKDFVSALRLDTPLLIGPHLGRHFAFLHPFVGLPVGRGAITQARTGIIHIQTLEQTLDTNAFTVFLGTAAGIHTDEISRLQIRGRNLDLAILSCHIQLLDRERAIIGYRNLSGRNREIFLGIFAVDIVVVIHAEAPEIVVVTAPYTVF